MSTMLQFARKINVLANKIDGNINKSIRRVALAVDQAVVLSTPVDKGVARSNWLASLSQPRNEEIKAYSQGSKLGLDEQANASAALAQGRGIIGKRKPGQDIYLSNNVSYIGLLNSGSSAQAPTNFVENAVEAGALVVKNTKVITSRI